MICLDTKNQILGMTKRFRIRDRAIIEELVELAEQLPSKRDCVMVKMRYRDGYSFVDMGSVMQMHPSNVSRQLKTICGKLVAIRENNIRF